MIIAFTGHRPSKFKNKHLIFDQVKKTLDTLLIAKRLCLSETYFIVGGCPGFDTIALEVLLSFNDLPKENITIAVPFIGFELYAGGDTATENAETKRFNQSCGVKMIEVGQTGTFGQKCFNRNKYMVDRADVLITNWDGSQGGTKNTVDLAVRKNIHIINITGGRVL